MFFDPLSTEVLLAIFDNLFAPFAARFEQQGILVEIHPDLKRYLCEQYTDQTRGARLLERAIEDEIVAPLTDKLLAGEIQAGMKLTVGEDMDLDIHEVQPDQLPRVDGNAQVPPIQPNEDPGIDPREVRNRETLEQLLQDLKNQLHDQGIEISLTKGALELLCSPYWKDQRDDLPTREAFEQLVKEPLLEKIRDGQFQASDCIQVDRNFDLSIVFKKIEVEDE